MVARRGSLVLVLVAAAALAAPAGVAAGAPPAVTHHVVESFDGTRLEATLFVPPGVSAQEPAPLVLRTHGWGGSRQTASGSSGTIDPGAGTLDRLLSEGYVVLTWDQRGFGCSGGQVRINDPDVEGLDVTALIDWALRHAPVETTEEGDPLVAMTGGSYAGGIQTAAAAVDPRIDALAPEISWSDLRYSLYSGSVVNQGWVSLLLGYGMSSGTFEGLDPTCRSGPHADALDPAVHQGVAEFVTTGRISQQTQGFLGKSSLAVYGAARPVAVPTLVLQGSVDTLFDLADGHGIVEHVRAQGADARFVIFCGGHVTCPASYADAGDRAYLDDAIVAWFARHLRDEDVDTGAAVSYRTNEGVWRDADSFPATASVPLTGEARHLPVVPVVDLPDAEAVAGLVAGGPPAGVPALPTTAARVATPGDPRSATVEVARAADGPLEVRGVPQVRLTVSGRTVPLAEALDRLGDTAATLPTRQVGDVLVGSLGPLGAVAGGLVSGIGGDAAPGGADESVHVFAKLVHREAGEVLNLQEGAVRVDLRAGGSVVDVPMPGLAYTVPAGDHLDLELSTASLMHATGRTPALIDVAVTGSVPVDRPGAGRAAGTPQGTAEPAPVPPPPVVSTRSTQGPLPASGGALAAWGLAGLIGAAACRHLSRS